MLVNLLEALMMICFGASWPVNIYKSYTSRTAKGKSLGFTIIIWFGYIIGIVRKIVQLAQGGGTSFDWLFWLGFIVYLVNIAEVSIDMGLYMRNKRLDAKADAMAS